VQWTTLHQPDNQDLESAHRGNACAPAWSGRKGGEAMTTTKNNRPPGDYDREKWRRLVEDFEWLEDHCWVLPPEERWLGKRDEKPNTATAPPPNAPAEKTNTLSEEDLRLAIDLGTKIAEAEARLKLTLKVRELAELERRRGKIIHLLKERAFDLAARRVPPGNA
jgi:hypothetical protein